MQRVHEMPFGAQLMARDRCRFSLWAPAANEVQLRLRDALLPMQRGADGWWQLETHATAGDAYRYRIDCEVLVPDPAARAQADDVHGASLVIDARSYEWGDGEWRGRPWHEAVIYELHVGTFTPAGTFRAVIAHLDGLVDLGVTAIELMPVGDFPGARDWGYDGVLPFAPDRRYGSPNDLKALIDAAHHRGLMVLLDVVYNHFGPEGNYLHRYAPAFFTERHHTPWGAAIDFQNRAVRDFVIHNALYWVEEFHLDGLRLDAVHAIRDDERPDILEELAAVVRARTPGRHVHLVLENDNNAAHYLQPQTGHYTAQWNDDFHHCLHVLLTGEEEGYYADFAADPIALLARSLSEGFAFQGEASAYRGARRGEPSRALPLTAFVNFLQNHDQIGNRAYGERLLSLTSPAALRAATALLLLAPAPPLLFMGQEWGSRQPFPFFCDFGADLAARVSEGRRQEFAHFHSFADATQRATIPDPQNAATAAALRWSDAQTVEARQWRHLHRELLQVRQRAIVPRLAGRRGTDARAAVIGECALAARWRLGDRVLVLLANLSPEPLADLVGPADGPLYATPEALGANHTLNGWSVVWYLTPPAAARVTLNGAVVLA